MFHIFLFVLATGQKLEYQTTYPTAKECIVARAKVLDQLLKDNPSVTRKDFDNEKFVLVCSKDKP